MLVEIGRTQRDRPLVLDLGALHLLIAGLSGQGKSSLLRVVLAQLAQRRDTQLIGVDRKRVELSAWRDRAAAVWCDDHDITNGLEGLVAFMDLRYAAMEAAELTEWPVTPAGPRVVVVVDEASGVVAERRNAALLRALLEPGRAAAFTIVLATQRAGADVVPTNIRDLCGARVAFATATVDSTRMVLGDFTDVAPAHELPRGQRDAGRCYAYSEGMTEPEQGRVYWLDPTEARRLAANTAHLRAPHLVPVDAAAHRARALAGAGLALTVPVAAPDRPDFDVHATSAPPSRPPQPWTAPTGAPVPFRPAQAPTAPLVGDLGEDAAVLLEVLRSRAPVPSGDLPSASGLPEGRCRRARQALARAGAIYQTSLGWDLA